MSRSMVLQALEIEGKGPRFYMVGTVRRISHEARIEWQRQMEAAVKDSFDFTQTKTVELGPPPKTGGETASDTGAQ